MINPLLSIDWFKVRMLAFEENVLTYRLENDVVRKIKFSSKKELDDALAEWVKAYHAADASTSDLV